MSRPDRVKVYVRIRPLSKKERQRNVKEIVRSTVDKKTGYRNEQCLSIFDPVSLQVTNKDLIDSWSRDFTFDKCLWSNVNLEDGLHATQQTVYEEIGVNVIEWTLQGFNCCVFAFGQTGSGKTHSMMGRIDGQVSMDLEDL